MKREYIIKNPEKVGMGKKRVYKEIRDIDVNPSTGEIVRESKIECTWVDREPDYIKVYTTSQLVSNECNEDLGKYIIAFSKWIHFANDEEPLFRLMVRTGKVEREDVARECGVSEKRMQSVIRMLVENEVFIPIFQDGKRLNAVYFVNPWFITRGDWKHVKELRDGFEYVRECDRDKIEKDYNVKIPCTFIDKNNRVYFARNSEVGV